MPPPPVKVSYLGSFFNLLFLFCWFTKKKKKKKKKKINEVKIVEQTLMLFINVISKKINRGCRQCDIDK